MRILVSGQAAAAVTLAQPRLLYQLDLGAAELSSSVELSRLFADCTDVLEVDCAQEAILDHIEHHWSIDRSIRLLLLVLDATQDEADLREYAALLDGLLADVNVRSAVVERLSAIALPSLIELNRVDLAFSDFGIAAGAFRDVLSGQHFLKRVISAFDALDDALFEGASSRERLREVVEEEGVIARLVNQLRVGGDISFIKLEVIAQHLQFRTPLSQWFAMLQTSTQRLRGKRFVNEAYEDEFAEEAEIKRVSSHSAYLAVRAAQLEVVDLLKGRRLDDARQRVVALINQQQANSNREQIGKTLSLLAQQAKVQDVPELQLEWAEWAARENPADPMTYGHLADALILTNRLSEAEGAVSSAEEVGGVLFAANQRARILRIRGDLDAARAAYLAAGEHFNDYPEVEHSWMGAADVLRDMGKYDEAIAEYDELTRRWPLNPLIWSGLGFTLLEAGRLEEAIRTFGRSTAQRVNKIAQNGKALAFRRTGRFAEANVLYDAVLALFPNDAEARCGRAEVYRARGQMTQALKEFEVAAERSPFVLKPRLGLASVLLEVGEVVKAQAEFELTAADHANEIAPLLGIIRCMRRRGLFKEALVAADDAVRKFPFSPAAKHMRALVYRSIGSIDAALLALDALLVKHPYYRRATLTKASILISIGRAKEAGYLLPNNNPRTASDWTAHLLKAFFLAKVGAVGAGNRHLEWGLTRCPFFTQRGRMRTALAAGEIRRGKTREARRLIEQCPSEVSNVVALHAFAASNREGRAQHILSEIRSSECSPKIIDLADEIARRMRLSAEQPKHSFDWIIAEEERMILSEAA